jgi:hypothetical protein
MKPSIAGICSRIPKSSIHTTRTVAIRRFHSTPCSCEDDVSKAPRPRATQQSTAKDARSRSGSSLKSAPVRNVKQSREKNVSSKNRTIAAPETTEIASPPVQSSIKEPQEPQSASTQLETSSPQPTKSKPSTISSLQDGLNPQSLITNHIATASSSPHAHRATILAAQAHLARRDSVSFGFDSLLAKALRYGKVVRFANEDEKLRAVALAQEQTEDAALRMSVQKKKDIRPGKIEFQAAPKKYREELIGRVLRGQYQEKTEESGRIAEIGKRLQFNETFTKKPGRGFLETLKRLMPQPGK